jgi:hypothetical protein
LFSPFDTNGLTTAWELKYFGATNINASGFTTRATTGLLCDSSLSRGRERS